MYNYWPEVGKNVNQSRRVWGALCDILIREGVEPKLAAIFYMAVTHAVVIFFLETCVLLAAIDRKLEGTHTGFLKKIAAKQARRKVDGV